MAGQKPMISETKLVTLSVANLERSVKFYGDVFGYVEMDRGQVAGSGLEKAWRMPNGMKGNCAVVGIQGINSGMLRLVQFDRPGEKIWDDYPPRDIIGHYAVNVGVDDLRAFWPRIIKAGAVQKAPPTFWTLTDELSAWDSQAYDLDGVLLDVFQIVAKGKARARMGEKIPPVSEVQTMAIHVGDALRSKAFYERLGFDELYYETMIENLEKFFDVPVGTRLQNINLMKSSLSLNGRIEITQYIGIKGTKPVRDRSVPPNTGILSISFETEDIETAGKIARKIGGQEICPPVPVVLPKSGKVKLATYFGPDGEMLEFYQPV